MTFTDITIGWMQLVDESRLEVIMKKVKKRVIFSRLVTLMLVVATMVSAISCMAPVGVAEAAKVKTVSSVNHNAIKLSEDKLYGFKSAASGWMMNTKGAGKSNGTNINLYPLDLSQPVTQLYSVTVVSEEDNIFRLSPSYDDTKFLDVRRYGAPFKEKQIICLWSEDNDPLLLKNFQLEYNPDGTLTIVFAEHPDMCISAASFSAASTYQQQLIVKRKTGAPEERFVLTDENGNPLYNDQEVTSQYNMQIALREYYKYYKEMGGDVDALLADEDYQDAVTRWLVAQLYNKFSGKYRYFTVSGTSPCYESHRESSHSCPNCYNINVMNTTWFKELFNIDKSITWTERNIDEYIPNQVGSANGYSCYGAGNVAQYLVYKTTDNDEVDITSTKGKFTKQFVESNARVGDLIRVKGHTVMVYDNAPGGLYVLDCNYNKTTLYNKTPLNCLIQLHFFSYTDSYYRGQDCWIVSVEEEQKAKKIKGFTKEFVVPLAPYLAE